MMEEEIVLSTLPKTWIFDLDGTLVKHNGYLLDGKDTLLPGAKKYLAELPAEDKVLIVTSRTEEYQEMTELFLAKNGIRYDAIFYGLPMGERILVNDAKPSGLQTAYAFNLKRDDFFLPEVCRSL